MSRTPPQLKGQEVPVPRGHQKLLELKKEP